MKKKIGLFVILAMLLVGLASCGSDDKTDKTKPVFSDATNGVLPEKNILVKTKTSEEDLLKDVTATDDMDGNVTVVVALGDFDFNKVGQYVLTYTAADKAGNVATATRTINVIDTVSPYFEYANAQTGKLPAFEALQYAPLDLLALEYLSVIDNYDTDLKATVKNDGGFNVEVAGTYTVTYVVKDSSGNETTAERDITLLPAVKYTEDVLKINDETHAAQFNNPNAMIDSGDGYGMGLRKINAVQVMTKAFYLEQLETLYTNYPSNANRPFLPYGVAVVLDANYKPVLVRNASYAIEAVYNQETETWDLHKGQDLTFIDATVGNTTTPAGILGGDFESYIPDGGFVLMCGSPLGGTNDTCKIFLLKNLLADAFTGGALSWDFVEGVATELLPKAQFEYIENYTTYYPQPDALDTPELKMEKHILSWQSISGAKEYVLYINGEMVLTTTTTTIKMIDLNLAPSADGETYQITIQAISSDIRYYGDSNMSEVLDYAMPNSQELSAPAIRLEENMLVWDEVEGAAGYAIYATQLGEPVLVATVTTLTYDLKDSEMVRKLIANAKISVKALGDDVEYLDSEFSNSVVYYCGIEQVIVINGEKQPVIVTTTADYFARRNDATEIGYANQSYLYLITDADQITSSHVEAYSFLVLFDKNGVVKAIINILNTTKQYYNYQWVDAASINYTSNASQIAPLVNILEAGDQLLIGRTGGTFTINGTMPTTAGRNVLANYFWGAYTSATDPWRSEHTIETFPSFEIKLANTSQLEAPVLTVDGSIISWETVNGAETYDIYVNDALVAENMNTNAFDLLDYVSSIGKSGAIGINYTDVKVHVVAKAQTKEDSEKVTHTYRLATQVTDGTHQLDVTYNLENALWNGGSGANCRLNDTVSSLFNGASYKRALDTYVKKGANYANNAYQAFMQNGIIVVLDKDLQVKQVRFGYVTAASIDKDYHITTPTTWNNNTVNATTGGGNFLNLENEIEDTDYVIIVTNCGSKNQLKAVCALFVNTNVESVITAKTAITDASLSDTRVDLAHTEYQIRYTITEVVE